MDFTLVTSVFETLRLTPPPNLTLLEAGTLRSAHLPPYPPDCPALLTGVDSRELAEHLRSVLSAIYPENHEIFLLDPKHLNTKTQSHQNTNDRNLVALSLGEFVVNRGQDQLFSGSTCLFIPPLEAGNSFESLAEIVAHLRAPNGCPWDREQTHASLRTHLLEETYETLAAIDSGDFASMREEFGDLLLQVALQTQIASEEGQFTITQVIKNIYDKLVRRHPHVFGGVAVEGVDHVLQNWEKLKEAERKTKGEEQKGLLDGIPAALPALSQAQEYQDRAARVGFDWPEIEGVLDKVAEEVEEIRQARDQEQLAGEIGDLLFVLVNLARWKKVDAESALRAANLKFKRRLRYVEDQARAQDKALSEMSLEELDDLWEQGKRNGG
jgi:tetrapyrrole methylase family protein/MazG family protein